MPLGATILSASLEITTGNTSANADTNGPWGVSQLLQPFSATSTYGDFGGMRGPDYRDGSASRPIGGFDNPAGGYGIIGTPAGTNSIRADETAVTDIMPIVQAWSSGAANHGVTIQALSSDHSTSNGWQIQTSSTSNVAARPRLNIEYTTASINTVSFQNGANGYAGTSAIVLNADGATINSADVEQTFIDGDPDNQFLVRFDDILSSEGGLVPAGSTIANAFLVVTTGDADVNVNAKTQGPFFTHQMLVDWDTDSVYSDFGPNGPQMADGELGEVAGVAFGRMAESESWVEVTDIVQNWVDGQANFGIDLSADGMTGDGWLLQMLGAGDSSLRPQLVVSYVVPEPTGTALAAVGSLCLLRRRRRQVR